MKLFLDSSESEHKSPLSVAPFLVGSSSRAVAVRGRKS